jgi:CheY-like chemotaxis protein
VPGIAGAVLLGSGEVALTLHVPELIERSFLELPRGQTGRLMAARTRKAKAPKRQTILITDDSPTYRNLAVSAVEAFGYRVIVAHDGQQAWEKMAEEKPDLLLTDLEMPRLNGLGLVERVRGDERTQGIPIIMFSTRASPEDRKRAQDAGVDVYIHKTDWNDRLLGDAIRKLLDE